MPNVTFSFDPACPWTWKTSRWLVSVAQERDLDIEWRAFSLSMANEGDIPDQFKTRLAASTKALRLIETLRAENRTKDIERFYEAIGERVHERGRDLDDSVLREAIDEAGVDDVAGALDDESLDAAVRTSHDAAFESAGPDIGSPVIQLDGVDRGIHGPIIEAGMNHEDALALWDAVERLMPVREFFEIKRGR